MATQNRNGNRMNVNVPRPTYWIYGMIAALILGWWIFGERTDAPVTGDWTVVERMVEAGDVEKIQVINRTEAQVYLRREAVERYRRDTVDKRLAHLPERGVQMTFTIGSVDALREDLRAAEQRSGHAVPVVYASRKKRQ